MLKNALIVNIVSTAENPKLGVKIPESQSRQNEKDAATKRNSTADKKGKKKGHKKPRVLKQICLHPECYKILSVQQEERVEATLKNIVEKKKRAAPTTSKPVQDTTKNQNQSNASKSNKKEADSKLNEKSQPQKQETKENGAPQSDQPESGPREANKPNTVMEEEREEQEANIAKMQAEGEAEKAEN